MPSPAPNAAVRVGIALGSNIGDKPANIRRAVALLEARGALRVTRFSAIYRTRPWGYRDQDFFANACVLGETHCTPDTLLAEAKAVEVLVGRTHTIRWGPRVIDVDLIFYGEQEIATPQLTLPHKDLFNRAFVLVPLAEIAPDLVIAGRSVAAAAKTIDPDGIEIWP